MRHLYFTGVLFFEKVGDDMNGSVTTLVLVAAAMFAFIGFMTVYKDNTEFEYLIV